MGRRRERRGDGKKGKGDINVTKGRGKEKGRRIGKKEVNSDERKKEIYDRQT